MATWFSKPVTRNHSHIGRWERMLEGTLTKKVGRWLLLLLIGIHGGSSMKVKCCCGSLVSWNATWIAVLGSDGFIRLFDLNAKRSSGTSKFPDDPCGMPKACIASHCGNGNDGDVALVDVGTGLDYFTLGYVSPSLKTDLSG
ncbi:hypothetical protein Golax_003621 [Gossypium laxum]|uniref:Uncharacterized protein n=1 Tax=Gossypium laxum TaxID=34288 RepID=A0A7J9AG76_9ROSI|nr:hypothetical protein [Gossypium laxum]